MSILAAAGQKLLPYLPKIADSLFDSETEQQQADIIEQQRSQMFTMQQEQQKKIMYIAGVGVSIMMIYMFIMSRIT